MKRTSAIAAVLALAMVFAVSGCRRVDLAEEGYLKTETRTVALEGAEEVQVDLNLGAGELRLSGADTGPNLCVGEFEYAREWRPEIDYDVSGGRGVLVVRQPDIRSWRPWGDKNTWDIEVSRDIPIDLRVTLGAGRSDLDLRNVLVKDLDATTGAGDATVDLSGTRDRSFSGRIETGAGRIVVRVPSDVGVRITGHREGVGDFTADGFKVDGRALVNDAYGRSAVTIELQVVRGIGETVFELVD